MRVLLAAAVLALDACGGGAVPAPDLDSLATSGTQLQDVVQRHCSAAPPAAEACTSTMQSYMAAARPHAEALRAGSEDMDACMRAMRYADRTDMRSMCDSLMDELQTHAGAGCAQDELARHCSVMEGLMSRVSGRMTEMRSMMDGRGMMGDGGGMMSGGMMMNGMCQP